MKLHVAGKFLTFVAVIVPQSREWVTTVPFFASSTVVDFPTGLFPLNVSTVMGLSLFASLLDVVSSGPAFARNGSAIAERMMLVSCMFAED